MVITIVIWIYATVLSFSYGFLFWRLTIQFGWVDKGVPAKFSLTVLVGLAFLTSIASFLSLFVRIGLLANLILIGGALIILINGHKDLIVLFRAYYSLAVHTHFLVWILGILFFAVVLIKTVGIPTNWDTGLYHAQAIRWLEEYPIVPGIGNLMDELAFNSSWLMASAVFSFTFLGLQSFHVLGGFIFMLVGAFFLHKVNCLLEGDIVPSNIAALILLFLARRLVIWEVSSPGTDLPAALLLWLIFILGVEHVENHEKDMFNIFVITLLSVFVVTIKLSSAPIIILIIALFVRNISLYRKLFISLITGCTFLLLPWAIRNVVLSGYLVYPFPAIDLFKFDWKVPHESAASAADWIKSWARLPGEDKDIVLRYKISEWLPLWYSHQKSIDLVILFTSLSGMVIYCLDLFANWFRSKSLEWTRVLLLTYVVALVGGIFWFWQAPDFRFGYGFLGFLAAFPLSILAANITRNLPKKYSRWPIFLAVIAMIMYQVPKLYHSPSEVAEYLVTPANYPQPSYHVDFVNGVNINVPGEYQCWYLPLPCSPYYNDKLVFRGEDVSDGFRIPDQK